METTNKEIISKFLVKKEEAYEILQKLIESNAPEADVREATTLYKFWEIMEMEEGEELGALLYEFAVLVDFDPKLIRPIAYQDAGFWTDVESMGFLEFQLNRLRLERSTRTISLLQSIDLGIKKLIELNDWKGLDKKRTNGVEAELRLEGDALEAQLKKRYDELPGEKEFNIPQWSKKEIEILTEAPVMTSEEIDDLLK